jgi:hypothetical protein
MPTTRVVNIQNDRCEVYIGRGGPFGNPYVIGKHGDRTEVIRKFRVYFYDRLKKDPDWKAKVEKLKGKTLGCFCFPKLCHGTILAEFIDGSVPPPPTVL